MPVARPYQVITDRIIALLEQGTAPWQKPWGGSADAPRNLFSQRPYNGMNVWLLGAMRYKSPFWCTFNQARAAGGSVKKGEKACPIVFWKVYDKPSKESEEVDKRFVLKMYYVFNAQQTEGLAIPQVDTTPRQFTPIEACEKLVGNYPRRPAIRHGMTQACYRPLSDVVDMPSPENFPLREHYYSTLFHELTHSTGHKDRLNRATLTDIVPFGTVSYAKEELVAEMGAAYLCGVAGIENQTIDNSAAYLKGWMKALRNDPKILVQAAGQAQKAVDFILGEKEDAHASL